VKTRQSAMRGTASTPLPVVKHCGLEVGLYRIILWDWVTHRSARQAQHFFTNFQWPLAAKLRIGSKKVSDAIMGRTSSITMASLVGIVRRTPALDQKCYVFLFDF